VYILLKIVNYLSITYKNKEVLRMKFKKQIITAITCAVVLLGIFLTVSYIGRDNNTTASKDDDKKQVTTEAEKKEDKAKEGEKTTEDKKPSNGTQDTDNNQKNVEDTEVSNDGQQTKKDEVKTGSYIVKKDDTLYSIARAYMPNHDFKEVIATILKTNKLENDNTIVEGQKIIIPYELALESKATSSTTVDKAKEENKETAQAVKTGKKYEIKSGDSLFKIAKEQLPQMAMTEAIEKIKAHNGLTNVNAIKAGDVIYIPQQ